MSILAYDHFPDDKECYRRIAFCDTKTGKLYTDLMEMHILELSKLPPEEKNETSLLQWMRFLGGKTRKDFEEMAKKNSELEEAYDVLDKLSADEKKRLEYETRQRAIRDCHPCRIPFFKPCCEKSHQYRNQIIHKDKYISKPGFLKQKGPNCCQYI